MKLWLVLVHPVRTSRERKSRVWKYLALAESVDDAREVVLRDENWRAAGLDVTLDVEEWPYRTASLGVDLR